MALLMIVLKMATLYPFFSKGLAFSIATSAAFNTLSSDIPSFPQGWILHLQLLLE